MVPWGRLATTLKSPSSTSSSDTNIDTYLRRAVMSSEAGTLWKLKRERLRGAGLALSVKQRGSLPIALQGEVAPANSKVPSKFPNSRARSRAPSCVHPVTR